MSITDKAKLKMILTDSKGRGRIFLVAKTVRRNSGCAYSAYICGVVNLIETGFVTIGRLSYTVYEPGWTVVYIQVI